MSYAPIPMVPGPVALHEDVIAVLGRDYGSGQVESDFLCLYDAAASASSWAQRTMSS